MAVQDIYGQNLSREEVLRLGQNNMPGSGTAGNGGTTTTGQQGGGTSGTQAADDPYLQYLLGNRPQLEPEDSNEPQKSDYERNKEWFDQYFPVVSREDEAQRQKRAMQAYRWGQFGNALGAIAQAIGGAKPAQNAAQPVMPDLAAWKAQLNTDRAKRAAMELQQQQQYTSAHNAWLTNNRAVRLQNARNLADWYKSINSYMASKGKAEQAHANAMEKQDAQQKGRETIVDMQHKNRTEENAQRIAGQISVKQTQGAGTARSGGGSKTDNSPLSAEERKAWENLKKNSTGKDRKTMQSIKTPAAARNYMNLRGAGASGQRGGGKKHNL